MISIGMPTFCNTSVVKAAASDMPRAIPRWLYVLNWGCRGRSPQPRPDRPEFPAHYHRVLIGATADWLMRGELSEAEAILTELCRGYRPDPVCLNLLGVVREAQARLWEARVCYRHALKVDRHYDPAWQNLRRVYELLTLSRCRECVALGDPACDRAFAAVARSMDQGGTP